MANTLKFKRGLLAGLPSAAVGEPLFTTDTFDLYIGTASGTQKYQKFIASGTTSQLLRGDGSLLTMPIVLTSPSNGQVLKYNGTSWVNDSDAGITGSGTTNYLPKFTGASTLGNSLLYETSNLIGIGTTSPTNGGSNGKWISIDGTSYSGGIIYTINSVPKAYTYVQSDLLKFQTESGVGIELITNGSHRARITSGGNFIINNASTDNGLRFQVTGDGYFSGNLGLGTSSPQNILDNFSSSARGLVIENAYPILAFSDTANSTYNLFVGTDSGEAYFWNRANGPIRFATNNTEKMRLDASGNLGLGVVPSASTIPYIDGGSNLMLSGRGNAYFNNNVVFDGGFKYIVNGAAGQYNISLGEHRWNTAISGSAGGNITFTQAMTLDASGRLLIGGTSTYDFNDAAKLVVSNTSGNSTISIVSGTSSYGYLAFADGTSGTDRYTGAIEYNHSTNYMSFRTNGGNYVMNLTASQNVQIGSFGSDAGYKLDVNGTMRVSGAAALGSTTITANNVSITFVDASNSNYTYTLQNYSSKFRLYNNNTATTVIDIASTGAATFSSSVSATSVTAGGRTVLAGSYIADLSGSGNDVGIVFGASGILSCTGSGTLTAKNLGSSTYPWGNLWAGAATFSSSVTAGGNLTVSGSNSYFGSQFGYIYFAEDQINAYYSTNAEATLNFNYYGYNQGTTQFRNFNVYNGKASSIFYLSGSTGAATFSSSLTAGGTMTIARPAMTTQADYDYRNIIVNSGFGAGYTAGRIQSLLAGFDSSIYGVDIGYSYDGSGYSLRFSTNDDVSGNPIDRLTISRTGAATFSSSVTLSGNLTVDTNTFFVDSNNNRVGIGTTTPGYPLDVQGTARVSSQIDAGSHIDLTGLLYHRNNIAVLNKANTGWVTWATRNTAGAESVVDLSNVGTFTSSGNLTVDTNTLFVDAANNRVGVKQSSPTSSLHVDGSNARSYVTKTANYTMTENDYTVLCDTTSGGFTITLPAASGCAGRIYCIKKTIGNSGVNNVTIDGNASETIDGSTTISLQCRSSVIIQSDGSNWWVLAEKNDASCI